MTPDEPAAKLSPLVWLSAFETGDPAIDDEHRELVLDINELSVLVTNGREWSEIIAKGKELRDKCIAHFRDEQRVFEKTRYEKRAAHAREHQHVQQQLDRILADIEN